MAQISEHIKYSNHKIHSYYHIGKIIVNLINKKCENNNKSTDHLYQIQKSLLLSILTPLKIMYQMLIGELIRELFLHRW